MFSKENESCKLIYKEERFMKILVKNNQKTIIFLICLYLFPEHNLKEILALFSKGEKNTFIILKWNTFYPGKDIRFVNYLKQ